MKAEVSWKKGALVQLRSQLSQEAPVTRLTSEHGIEAQVTEGEIAVRFPQAFRIARLPFVFI